MGSFSFAHCHWVGEQKILTEPLEDSVRLDPTSITKRDGPYHQPIIYLDSKSAPFYQLRRRCSVWVKNNACYCCPLACKKSGLTRGKYGGIVHDGPEYETGTMLGSNLIISDMAGMLKAVYNVDDLGVDAISTGNVIGFLWKPMRKG